MGGYLILPLLFGAMWWFTIRPQQQRLRAQRALISSISSGDVVLTAGGLVGRIISMDDEELMLDVGRGTPVEVRVVRAAVTRRISPDASDSPHSPIEE
ncbi:MAG: preprotein translocase subunit YajC [Actinomycetota bacterium]|jgi:preprotein translocase subunit YajC|nr:preprotein translocase subunit YajC [Actinomycetota bacterium]